MTTTIQKINQIGQSIWYDNIERKLLKDGTLEGMFKRGEIRGITSNPSIFNKAISQSDEYDEEIKSLTREGFSRENIITSLEMRMKCGIGKCGRCNVGNKYVCKDGPIFSLIELDELTKEY